MNCSILVPPALWMRRKRIGCENLQRLLILNEGATGATFSKSTNFYNNLFSSPTLCIVKIICKMVKQLEIIKKNTNLSARVHHSLQIKLAALVLPPPFWQMVPHATRPIKTGYVRKPQSPVGILYRFQSVALGTCAVHVSAGVGCGEEHTDPSDVITVVGSVRWLEEEGFVFMRLEVIDTVPFAHPGGKEG